MREKVSNSYRNLPDDKGRFGIHGGRFVAETLMPLILEVEKSYYEARQGSEFFIRTALLSKTLYWPPLTALFCPAHERAFWRGKIIFQTR